MLPYEISAADDSDLARVLKANRDSIHELLHEHGALLFRGFGVHDVTQFRDVAAGFTPGLLDYTYRSTPRTKAEQGIYTSTEYPPDQQIPMHNENSYAATWPEKLWFYSHQAAAAGGATTLADSRTVLDRIGPEVRRRFADKGVKYIRNYGGGLDLPWQEVFQTRDRAVVEKFCADNAMTCEWSGDQLRTTQIRPAMAVHPATGEQVWFNQAHLFHLSAMDDETREALVALFSAEGVPRNAVFGDGSEIPDADLAEVREAYRAEMVDVEWRDGDVLLVENLLAAHGRRPYTPPRKVLVAMADATSNN